MYEEYWGLREKPFQNTSDPRFLYRSRGHEEALARLVYGVEEQMGLLAGFVKKADRVDRETILEELKDFSR